MAFRARTEWTHGGTTESVHATLGRYAITFSPGAEGRLPYTDVTEVWQYGSYIHIRFPDGEAKMDMQEQRRARRFARKMEDAPSPLEVLGARQGDAVAVVGLPDAWVYRLLRRRRLQEAVRAPAGVDMLVVGVSDERSLASIGACLATLKSGGTLWVVYPRGHREIGTEAVAKAGLYFDLDGELELQVSSRHAALKLVPRPPVPVASS
ncbi:MAG: hypothetical protein V4510_09160 [bacterium]